MVNYFFCFELYFLYSKINFYHRARRTLPGTMITNYTKFVLIYTEAMSTIYTRKTQMFIILPTMSDRVGDDGVGVSGPGGRGDHGSSTSAS